MRKDVEMTISAPLVSVCLITYNHANYIRKAVEGVMMQNVNFTWEFIIADDFSTDGTREILLDYKDKYPEIIKLILQEKNVGAFKNWSDLLDCAISKYISYFEGDDYWTDPYKLQKQVAFLELNDDYAACVTESLMDYGTYQRRYSNKDLSCDISSSSILLESYYATNTFVFRNNVIGIGRIFEESPLGDTLLLYLLSLKGKIRYFPEVTGVYRKHSAGIFTGTDGIILMKRQLLFYELLIKYGYLEHKSVLEGLIQEFKIGIAYQHFYRGERNAGMTYLLQVNLLTYFKEWKMTLKCIGHFVIK